MRTCKFNGVEYEVNEEQFSYNTTTEMNTGAILKDIKGLVGSTRSFDKSPGTVYLRSFGKLVAATTAAGCRMEVYDNGFAIYERPDTAAVLRMEYVGREWYEGDRDLERCAQTVDLSDATWVVAVMMKGEDRLEKWRGQRDASALVSLYDMGAADSETGEAMEYEVDAGVDVEMEMLDKQDADAVIQALTRRQCECATMRYALGMTDREIASVLGIRHQNVNKALQSARWKAKKYLKTFEG